MACGRGRHAAWEGVLWALLLLWAPVAPASDFEALRVQYVRYFSNTTLVVDPAVPSTCAYLPLGEGLVLGGGGPTRRCGTCGDCPYQDRASALCTGSSGQGLISGITEATMQSRCAADPDCAAYSKTADGSGGFKFRPLFQMKGVDPADNGWTHYEKRCGNWDQLVARSNLLQLNDTRSRSAAGCLDWVRANVDWGNTTRFDFNSDADAAVFEELVRQYLPCLALGYLTADANRAALLNGTLSVFRWLLQRGINKDMRPVEDAGMQFGEWDLEGRMSYGGTSAHYFLRMEGGWGKTVLLLRRELQEAGLLAEVMAPLRVWTGWWEHGASLLDTAWMAYPGHGSDQARIMVNDRFAYVLALDADGDDQGTQAQHMEVLLRWTQMALAEHSLRTDALKPDGTAYHHQMHYGNAYSVHLLRYAAPMAYVLRGSPYALPAASVQSLGKGLWVMQLYAADFSCPRAIGGRILEVVDILRDFWETFILLGALAADYPGLAQYDPAGVAVRLARLRGSLQGNDPEPMRLYARLQAAATPEAPPTAGSFPLPFAAAQVHRRGRWMAFVKGFSAEVKDSFEGWGKKNRYGRYQGAGSLTLFTAGDPVVSAAASGWAVDGYDWYHVPGTTAPHREAAPGFKDGWGRGLYADGPDAFAGGVADSRGDGAFGFHMEDMQELDPTKALAGSKSYFMFGDLIVALGAGFRSLAADAPVHTTLFQFGLAGAPGGASTPVWVDGVAAAGLPFSFTADDGEVRVRDPAGNGYIVQSGPGARLEVQRRNQSSVGPGGDTRTSGAWATAYLDHGTPPFASPPAYHYAVLVNTTAADLGSFGRAATYRVVAQSAAVHAVEHRPTNKTGYVFFRGTAGTSDELTAEPVIAASRPCAVLATDRGEGRLAVAVANPALGWADPGHPVGNGILDLDKAHSSQSWLLYRLYALPQETVLTLKGHWALERVAGSPTPHIAGDAPNVTLATEGADTQLRIAAIHGMSVEVELISPQACPTVADAGQFGYMECPRMQALLSAGQCRQLEGCGAMYCPGLSAKEVVDQCAP